MSSLDTIPLSTSAYLADTQHLSLPEHGAYLLILMTMWRAGGWIKDDDRLLANICKISLKKWLSIAPVIRHLLLAKDGRLSQKRLLSESKKAEDVVSKNRANGAKGGAAKALKNKEQGLATAKVSLPHPLPHPLPDRQNPEKPTLSFLEESKNLESKKRKKAGTALSSDWQPTASDRAYGRELGLTDSTIDQFAEDMRVWAQANANREVARKADWSATFKGWMRRNRQQKTHGPPARGGGWAKFVLKRARERESDERNVNGSTVEGTISSNFDSGIPQIPDLDHSRRA